MKDSRSLMRSTSALIAAALLLAACTPPEPVQTGGVGFGGYDTYLAQREADLRTGQRTVYTNVAPPAPGFGAPGPVPAVGTGQIVSGPIGAPLPQVAQPPLQPAAPVQTAGAVAPVNPNNTGISDEQDFSAVSSRESIESDRQRMAANRAQFQQIAPTALPERQGASVSPVIEYAINAPNRLGQSIYRRSGIALAQHERACARYASPTEAQEAFLRAGGPQRDGRNLDPDGDGFACTWDPTPFQKVRQ